MNVIIISAVLTLHPLTRPVTDARAIGFNVVNLQSGNFTADAAYTAATAGALRAGVLRYPGGNLADFWDWRTGWCVATTEARGCPRCRNPCTNKATPRIYLLDEFAVAVRRAAARSVFTLNMLTDTLSSQLEFLAAAQRLGLLDASTYVELGGEFYWGKYSGRWPMAADYVVLANQWAAAIKGRFPMVSVIAIAAHAMPLSPDEEEAADAHDRASTWNAQLYARVSAHIDGVSLHPYLHLDDDRKGGGALQPGVPARAPGDGPSGWSRNASVQQLFVDRVLRSEEGMESLLGLPFWLATEASGNAATRSKLPARLRLVVTEFNVMERAGPFKLSWAHALFVGAMALNLLALPQTDAVLLHVLLNGWGWGGLYETTSDFTPRGTPPSGSSASAIGDGGCLIPACTHLLTAPYLPTAVGSMLGALSAAFAGTSELTVFTPPNATNRTGLRPSSRLGTLTYPSILALRLRGQPASGGVRSTRYLALSLAPFKQSFGPFSPSQPCASFSTHASPDASGSPAAWVSTTAPVRTATHHCRGASSIELPPYSLTTVELAPPLPLPLRVDAASRRAVQVGEVPEEMARVEAAAAPSSSSAIDDPSTDPVSSASALPPIQPPLGYQPNIVFILTDDMDTVLGRHGYSSLGALEAMPIARRLLLDEGASVDNFFVNTPICCPSRTEFFTGRYFHNVGPPNDQSGSCMHADTSRATSNTTGLFGLLTRAGYEVGVFGKVTNDQSKTLHELLAARSAAYIDSPIDYNNYLGQPYFRAFPNGTSLTETLDPEDPPFGTLYQTTQIGNRTLRWLDAVTAHQSPGAPPFFAYLGPHAPHFPATPAPWYENAFDDLSAPITPNYNLSSPNKAQHVAQNPPLTARVRCWEDQHFRDRWRSLLSVDDLLAAVYGLLDARGVLARTYLIYSSDHGYKQGQWRIGTSKQHPYETDIRVPFLIRGPGVTAASRHSTQISGNVDVMPTILHLAAGEQFVKAIGMDGRSMASWLMSGEGGVGLAAATGAAQTGAAAPRWRDAFLNEYLSVGTYYNDHSPVWEASGRTTKRCGGPMPCGPHIDDCKSIAHVCNESSGVGDGKCWFVDSTHSNSWRQLRILNASTNWNYVEYDPAWRFEASDPTGAGLQHYELYDIAADPYQIHNLYPTIDKATRAALHAQLAAYWSCSGSSCP